MKTDGVDLADVTIVVPTRNEASNIGAFIQSIPDKVKLILVDSSDDDTAEIASRLHPNNTIVYRAIMPISPARHLGAQLASTRWLLFSDADVVFSEDYFRKLQTIGGLHSFFGPKLSLGEFHRYYKRIAGWQKLANRLSIPAVSGSNFVIRRDVYFSTGGFDVNLRVNEDSELGWRTGRLGYRIRYIPDLVVYANDHRRLCRGAFKKSAHSITRCFLLYFNLIPKRWRSSDWGYWTPAH